MERNDVGRARPSGRRPRLQERMRQERRAVYRQAINEAAERLFADKGMERSRMQEIAAEAGISLGTLYAVIDGKESLLEVIQRTRIGEFFACIRAASDSHSDTLARHLAVVRLGAQFFLDHPDFLRMCCRSGFGWAFALDGSAASKRAWDEGASIPRELFRRGVEEGIYVAEDPELLTRKMVALQQAELTWWVDRGMAAPHREVVERIESQFLRAFCVAATRKKPLSRRLRRPS
jgi:AcrR family transcriptional regulator